jgi:hypothetical protein
MGNLTDDPEKKFIEEDRLRGEESKRGEQNVSRGKRTTTC